MTQQVWGTGFLVHIMWSPHILHIDSSVEWEMSTEMNEAYSVEVCKINTEIDGTSSVKCKMNTEGDGAFIIHLHQYSSNSTKNCSVSQINQISPQNAYHCVRHTTCCQIS